MKQLLSILILATFTAHSQINLNNKGPSLPFFIDAGLEVHVDGSVNNIAGATMQFKSTGTAIMEFDEHFSNSGTLTAGQGLLKLTGSASQNLNFGGDDLYNLEINNSAGGVFTNASSVDKDVTFTLGNFTTTDANLLTFNTGAGATGANDASHVDGPVSKVFNLASPFTFPVGHGSSYNSIAYTPDGTGETTMKAKFNYSQPTDRTSLGTGVCKVSNVEYWDFTRTSGSEDGAVTLEWDGESDVSDLSDLLVAYWDASASVWQDGAGTASGNTIPSNGSMTKFNRYTLGSSTCINTLPIELIEFDAVPNANEDVDVSWVTGSEINNDYFVIERSKGGANWIPLDSLPGAGDSYVELNYAYVDNTPHNGVSYYRLRQVDYDKNYSYSDVKMVKFEGLEIVALFPNPSAGNVNYIIKSSEEGTLIMNVYDAIGKKIQSKKIQITEGLNQVSNEINAAEGKYFISVTMSDGKYYDYDFVLIK